MTELEAAQSIIAAAENAWMADHSGKTSIHFIVQYLAIALREVREQSVEKCVDIVERWDMQTPSKETVIKHMRKLKEPRT
jgi:hypothetical protein